MTQVKRVGALHLRDNMPRRCPAIRRNALLVAAVVSICLPAAAASAANATAQGLVMQMSNDVLKKLKSDPDIRNGDVDKVVALVNSDVLPNVDLARMTATATGHHWREASPVQRAQLEQEFGQLVVRTYAGALIQVKNETVGFFPQRHRITGGRDEVRTEVHGAGNPIPVNYRLLQSPTGWKIVDVGVMGVWLAENYEGSFEHQIDVRGIDGPIATLVAKNKANGG